jgi:hypothetical protein
LWFPGHPGLVSGITIGGFGLGALIFDPVTTKLVNPGNEEATAGVFAWSVNENFQPMFRTYLAMVAGLALVGVAAVF